MLNEIYSRHTGMDVEIIGEIFFFFHFPIIERCHDSEEEVYLYFIGTSFRGEKVSRMPDYNLVFYITDSFDLLFSSLGL